MKSAVVLPPWGSEEENIRSRIVTRDAKEREHEGLKCLKWPRRSEEANLASRNFTRIKPHKEVFSEMRQAFLQTESKRFLNGLREGLAVAKTVLGLQLTLRTYINRARSLENKTRRWLRQNVSERDVRRDVTMDMRIRCRAVWEVLERVLEENRRVPKASLTDLAAVVPAIYNLVYP